MLRRLYVNNKSFITYIAVVYIDKAIYFLLPMLVLYAYNDKLRYNEVEYICSISNIIVPFLTFISSYAFYGYKIADDKGHFIEQYINFSSISAILVSSLTFVGCITAKKLGVKGVESVELYVALRTGFYLYVQYLNGYYRLIDKPVKAVMCSILVNCLSAAILVLFRLLGIGQALNAFFIPETVFAVVALHFIFKSDASFTLPKYWDFILRSIRFAWPIVISSGAVAFVTNYGKVYAFNFLSQNEMYSFSFVMRLVMLIQMAHSAVVSFFSKDLYLNGYTKKFIIYYSFTVFCSVSGSFVVMLLYNKFFAKQIIPIDSTVLLIFLYTILHLLGTVFEIDFGRNNKNIYILIFSLCACAVYMILVFAVGVTNTTTLAAYMIAYALVYDAAIITTWRKLIR